MALKVSRKRLDGLAQKGAVVEGSKDSKPKTPKPRPAPVSVQIEGLKDLVSVAEASVEVAKVNQMTAEQLREAMSYSTNQPVHRAERVRLVVVRDKSGLIEYIDVERESSALLKH